MKLPSLIKIIAITSFASVCNAGEVTVSNEVIAISKPNFISITSPILRIFNPNSFDVNVRVSLRQVNSETAATSSTSQPFGTIQETQTYTNYAAQETITIPSNGQWILNRDNISIPPLPTVACPQLPIAVPGVNLTCSAGAVNITWQDSFVRNNGTIRQVSPLKVFLENQRTTVDLQNNDVQIERFALTQVN